MIFFSHIERTAGTTVHVYFSKYFGPPDFTPGCILCPRFMVVSSPADLPQCADIIRQLPDRHYYIGAHASLGELYAAGIDVMHDDIVFTTVRNPVERAISLYYLMQRSPSWFTWAPEGLWDRGFEHFYKATRDAGAYFRNDHCRRISGHEDAAQTIDLIRRKFNIVGSAAHMESFETALVKACADVVPGFRIAPSRENAAWHVGDDRSRWERKSRISELASRELIDLILSDNEADAEVVRFVEETHAGVFVNTQKNRSRAHSAAPGDPQDGTAEAVG